MIKLVKEHIDEEAMGGVSAPMATLTNVPGAGTAVPPGANGALGSGDRWDNKPAKGKKKKKAKGPFAKPATQSTKPIREMNQNPFDKGAEMMRNAMAAKGHKVEMPFEKGDSQTNTVKQKNYDTKPRKKSTYTKKYEVMSYDDFSKKLFENDDTGNKESLKYVNGKNELKKIGISFVFKMIDDKHQIAFIKDDTDEIQEKLEAAGWKKGETKTEQTGKIEPYTKEDLILSIYTGEFDHPYVTLVDAKKDTTPEEDTEEESE